MSGVPTSRHPRPGAHGRSPEEIRSDIAAQRDQLAGSVEALRGRVSELTDWRAQVREHRTELITGAAVVGLVIGGLIAFGRRRR